MERNLGAGNQKNRRVINKTIAGKDIRVLPLSEGAFQLEEDEEEK